MKIVKTKTDSFKVDDDIYNDFLTGKIKRTRTQVGRCYITIFSDKGVKEKEINLAKYVIGHNLKDGIKIGFKDGDTTNCCRDNLIIGTSGVFKGYSTKYYGVSKLRKNRFRTSIFLKDTLEGVTAGVYKDEDTAAIAYNKAMSLLYSDFVPNIVDMPKSRYDEIFGNVQVYVLKRKTRQGSNKKLEGTSSIYTGVSERKLNGVLTGKWVSGIKIPKGDRFHIGQFDNELVAAQAYNEVAKLLYGDSARLNNVPLPMHPVIDMEVIKEKIKKRLP